MRGPLQLAERVAGSRRHLWRRTVCLSVAGALLNGLAIVVLLPLAGALIGGDPARALLWVGVVVALLIVESALRVRELDWGYRHFPDVLAEIQLRLGRRLRTIPAEELARRRSGDLATVVSGDANMATMASGEIATIFFRLVAIPAALVVALLVIDWRLPLAALAGALVAAPAMLRTHRTLAADGAEIARRDAETADRIVEYVQGLPVLKAADQTGERSRRLVDALDAQGRALNASQSRLTGSLTFVGIGANLTVAAVIAAATALALGAQLDAATVAAVVLAAAGLAEPITYAALMRSVFDIAEAGLNRVEDLLAVPPLPVPDLPRPITTFDVELDGVTFTYRGQDTPALDGVSLRAPAGSLTALIGPSGGGKTTVTRMLTRFADPQAGTVRIGGVDLRSVDPGELMRHVAVVFQDVHLFDTTVAENVAMARPGATPAQVAAALEAAHCGPLLARLPRGADTRVGEIGGMLSGGERQRVAIARALVKDAPIVLLDEPTSALDTESEAAVQAAIDRLVADRTVIVIAHRLSTIVAADRIVVLDGGRVVETGDHASLLDAGGRYATMWAAQTRARAWTVTAPATAP